MRLTRREFASLAGLAVASGALPVKAFEPKQLGRLQRFWYSSEVDLALGDDKY